MKITDKKVAVILLAAGGSARMGTQKLLLDMGGIPIMRRIAMEALKSHTSAVTVVTGYDEEEIKNCLSGLPVHMFITIAGKQDNPPPLYAEYNM